MSRIPEYPWLRLIDIRKANPGEAIIGRDGEIFPHIGCAPSHKVCPVVAPDNAYGAIDLSALKIPEGYEIDGASAAEAFGEIKRGEWYLSADLDNAIRSPGPHEFHGDSRRIRLRKITPKTRKVLVVEFADPTPNLIGAYGYRAPKTSLYSSRTHRVEERPI